MAVLSQRKPPISRHRFDGLVMRKEFDVDDKLKQMITDWDDPYGARAVPEAEDLISELRIALAGKEGVIEALNDDLQYYKLRAG